MGNRISLASTQRLRRSRKGRSPRELARLSATSHGSAPNGRAPSARRERLVAGDGEAPLPHSGRCRAFVFLMPQSFEA